MALSPMMQQYKRIKDEYPDCFVMFRLGDFYELFFDDAISASKILELTLTGRNCGLEERAPMCGVPYHSVDSYITKLVNEGYKVAICEQIEDPSLAKGIVERDVIRVITPGTIDADSTADNIYICSISISNSLAGLAIADISTGEFICAEIDVEQGMQNLYSELAKYNPREIIISEDNFQQVESHIKNEQLNSYVNPVDSSYYKQDSCAKHIMSQFKVNALLSLGLDGRAELISAVGSLLMYLIDTQKQVQSQILTLEIKNSSDSMRLDRSTMRNLELLETIYNSDVHGSLLWVLNKTRTAMGSRLLKSWIREPLVNVSKINKRLDAVTAFKENPIVSNNIVQSLKQIYDFQRLSARIASQKANARDLIALKQTLATLPDIQEQLSYLDAELINDIKSNISNFDEIYALIDKAIVEEPPFALTEGGIIKDGYSTSLDELKISIKDAKDWILNLEPTEKERTGIKTLKVGYNKVFGYYIDVSKGMIDRVPDDYIRKQTLVNNERYITPELKEKEGLVLTAENKINNLEYEIFKVIRASIEPYIQALQQASSAVAMLDVLISLAIVATENNYTKPIIDESDAIEIRCGRHPTVEKLIGDGMFVSNDTNIDLDTNSMLIITGPNMAGKSTYMRQTAIIVLMAQMGSYVPAEYSHIGIVDRVFTRIGASDNLAYGQSTFFVEMSELANILRNASSRSLVILDEIGRGTSTWDGLSIAWSTVEYLCRENARIRTMFATHYHELTALSEEFSCIHNLSVSVAEENNEIVLLHNIVDGPANKSYGIHVAKIAGIPDEIRHRASIKLRELENNSYHGDISTQLSLDNFDYALDYNDYINEINNIDINSLTPLDALNRLKELIDKANTIGGNNND